MKKKIKYLLPMMTLLFCFENSFAQKEKKFWLTGSARSMLLSDRADINDVEEDSLTAKLLNSGHTLADMDINIKPNENLYIVSTVRIRNDHGGYWGSGTSFDLRQLYMKGLIADAIRFQIGDVNYKMTDYTFFNPDSFIDRNPIRGLQSMTDFRDQDLFYTDDNTWRQQGAAIDFGLDFNKIIDELNFDFFTFRLRATNFGSLDDQLISGGMGELKINKNISAEGHFTSTYEIEGTGNSDAYFKNNIGSGAVNYQTQVKDWNIRARGEFGTSLWERNELIRENKIEDFFYDFSVEGKNKKETVIASIGFREVGPNFRSIAAQTQRVNWNASPEAYSRYGNDQNLRTFGMIDMYRDATIYRFNFNENLMDYNPSYGNISPYGKATPNRRMLSAQIDYADEQERFNVGAQVQTGGEVIGQGTNSLRSFMDVTLDAELMVSKLIGVEKEISVNASFWNENTSRDAEAEFDGVDFSNTMISIGVEANVYENLDLLLNWQSLNSSGNELLNRRNDLGEIIGYNVLDTEFSESIIVGGIRYRFNEKSNLHLLWNSFVFEDSKSESIPYDINSWSILYSLKF